MDCFPYERPNIYDYLHVDITVAQSRDLSYKVPAPPVNPTPITISSPTLVFASKYVEWLKKKLNAFIPSDDLYGLMEILDVHRRVPRPVLTKTDCISAVVWVAVANARRDANRDAHRPYPFGSFRTAVNTRAKLSPALPDDYFGNMFEHATCRTSDAELHMTTGDDRDGPLRQYLHCAAYHALKIRVAIDGVTNASMRRRLARVARLADVQDTVTAIPAFDKAFGLDFGSLATFGADLEFDIPGTAGSRADFCRKIMPGQEGIANLLPRRGGTQGDADWEVAVSLRKEQAELVAKGLMATGLLKKVINL